MMLKTYVVFILANNHINVRHVFIARLYEKLLLILLFCCSVMTFSICDSCLHFWFFPKMYFAFFIIMNIFDPIELYLKTQPFPFV